MLKTAAITGKINGNPKILMNNLLKIKSLRKIALAIGIANKQAKKEAEITMNNDKSNPSDIWLVDSSL